MNQMLYREYEGWLALVVCILGNVTPESAFHLLEQGGRRQWTEDDIDLISQYRDEGVSWSEIARRFGATKVTVQRVWRYWVYDKARKERKRHEKSSHHTAHSSNSYGNR